jgi:arylsulfatase A-like enzyme
MFDTMRPLLSACLLGLPLASAVQAAEGPRRPVNLIFIVTDQQRFDAMGCAGNTVVKTPNMDRLAREGVRFTRAYAGCPVCGPARATMLTGCTNETNRVVDNGIADLKDSTPAQVPRLPTFDQILLRNGYRGEYHGKWHCPYHWAQDYSRPVRWLNGKTPPAGSTADGSDAETFKRFISDHVPLRPLRPGEKMEGRYGRPYLPDALDPNHAPASDATPAGAGPVKKSSQGETYGCLVDIPLDYTLTAYAARQGLEALDRLKGGPFTLTISIDPPHPPFVIPRPYYGMYPASAIPLPTTIADPRTNSPYLIRDTPGDGNPYGNPDRVREMRSVYYGMVTEVDTWVGRILDRVQELGLAERTLVIFTSDHGEMLGDHGMHSKNIFLDGSVRIPLIMRLPGVIPAGTVVDAPVSQVDYLATILDYLQMPAPANEGRSLKPLVDGSEQGQGRVVFSEWPVSNVPGFMVCDGRWKLLFGRGPDIASLDALYDLVKDPNELTNLLGGNPAIEQYRPEAERLKGLLVARLRSIKSPNAEAVAARPVTAQQPLAVKKKAKR